MITTYLICSAARERLTVILSGMGGDEVFAGYPRHLAAQIGRLADVLPAARAGRDPPRASRATLTLGRPGRMRGPRRNLRKLAGGLDRDPVDALPHLLLVLPAGGAERRAGAGLARASSTATTRSAGTAATSTASRASTG